MNPQRKDVWKGCRAEKRMNKIAAPIVDELFAPLSSESLKLLHSVPSLIEKTFPMPGRFRAGLPADVAELSRLQTSNRGERDLSYLSRPGHLSAYLRYFLPWNIFRLCKLLPNLDISLSPDDVILDLGCGPLSMACALWISRPDLRKIPLELRCVDRTAPVLLAGRKFFSALSGHNYPDNKYTWKIITIRENINPDHLYKNKPASLVCAANVFNEIYAKVSPNNSADICEAAQSAARFLESCVKRNTEAGATSILVAEPGVPLMGSFISQLRSALIDRQYFPAGPCPHSNTCPIPGSGTGKKRWCHFAFDTVEVPTELHRLSASAGIPKDRAVLSFLHARGSAGQKVVSDSAGSSALPNGRFQARVISDAFPLPEGKCGRYCCSESGLVLLTGKRYAVEACASGSLITVFADKNGKKDSKSGALLAELLCN